MTGSASVRQGGLTPSPHHTAPEAMQAFEEVLFEATKGLKADKACAQGEQFQD